MSRNEERLNIKEVIMHPKFDDETAENDIAVIKVEGSFNCSSDKIYPACLPNTEVSLTLLVSLGTITMLEIHLHWLAGHHPLWLGEAVSSI